MARRQVSHNDPRSTFDTGMVTGFALVLRALVREPVSVRKQGRVAFIVFVHGNLLLGSRPAVAERPCKVVVTEKDLGDAAALGPRQPGGNPRVSVGERVRD